MAAAGGRADALAGTLAQMPGSPSRLFGRFRGREPKLPSERDWERSAVLVPRAAPRRPELVSDGSGLSFPLAALDGPAGPMDLQDPAVAALLAQLVSEATQRGEYPASGHDPATAAGPQARLEGWRLLARSDDDALFALGRPPRMRIVAVHRDGRKHTWQCRASSAARPLRAARDAIRASSWRLDPTQELRPDDTILRVLVSEQALAGGQSASGRVLPPDLFADDGELVLTIFVSPRPGFQTGARNPETPVRVELPHGVGSRRLVDGALVSAPAS